MLHADSSADLRSPAVDPALWPLDPEVVFLNHGSFGSCPLAVLEQQSELRRRLERQPVRFMVRELEALQDTARTRLAGFVGAHPDDLALITNATSGVNTVLRSLEFDAGDELLVTDHEYNACRNALDFAAQRNGAQVVVAPLPFPVAGPGEIIDRILAAVTTRTRVLLIDHVSSQTGLVMPVRELVRELNERGIDTLVDGAHAPGMVPVNLDELGAAFYAANCHKWLCAPKGAAFLHVRRHRQHEIRPLVISHGANSPRRDRSRFQFEFGWTGTSDPTPSLCIPAAIDFMTGVLPGGWPAVMNRNRSLALAARDVLCRALEIAAPAPAGMLGSLASVPVPDAASSEPPRSALYLDPWQNVLLEHHGVEVPIMPWPSPPKRLLRISAQLYNSLPQYEKLAGALRALIDEG